MKRIVFDSFALLALFRNEGGREEISTLLTEIANGEKEGSISVINVGEVYYISHRKDGKEKAEDVLMAMLHFPLEIIEADLNLTIMASKLKAKYKFSYADAFAAALTISKKAVLITGDKEFKHLEGEPNFKVKFI